MVSNLSLLTAMDLLDNISTILEKTFKFWTKTEKKLSKLWLKALQMLKKVLSLYLINKDILMKTVKLSELPVSKECSNKMENQSTEQFIKSGSLINIHSKLETPLNILLMKWMVWQEIWKSQSKLSSSLLKNLLNSVILITTWHFTILKRVRKIQFSIIVSLLWVDLETNTKSILYLGIGKMDKLSSVW